MQYKLLALSTVKPEREIFTTHIHPHSSREKGKKKKKKPHLYYPSPKYSRNTIPDKLLLGHTRPVLMVSFP